MIRNLELLIEALLKKLIFKTKVERRVRDFLVSREIHKISLRKFMDLFIPKELSPDFDFYWGTPIMQQPQFGRYLRDSALLSITEADISAKFHQEWMFRLDILKAYELRNCPANKPRR